MRAEHYEGFQSEPAACRQTLLFRKIYMQENTENVIEVSHLTKRYKLYSITVTAWQMHLEWESMHIIPSISP